MAKVSEDNIGGIEQFGSPARRILTVWLPLGVFVFVLPFPFYRGALMSGALLGSLPAVILYSFFVDYYVSSMTGAVKE